MEAKFIAFFEASDHRIWLRNFITGLRIVDGIERLLKIHTREGKKSGIYIFSLILKYILKNKTLYKPFTQNKLFF